MGENKDGLRIQPVATGQGVEMLHVPEPDLRAQVERLSLLYKVGIALSAEKNTDRLVETILLEAKRLCNADGGTLYIRDEDDDKLYFKILHTDSLDLHVGGTSGREVTLPPIALHGPDGRENVANVASYAALLKRRVHIEDAYDTTEFDFSGTREFDKRNKYRSQSFLTIPLVNTEDRVIGVLQLLNAKDPQTGEVCGFREEHQRIVEALASQAAIALDNKLLIDSQKRLLQSFIRLIATAIDAKSPYTGAHCERVPIVAEMLARAACDAKEGLFGEFALTEDEWEELRVAAWLHDCGKITTPVHVMDKATKLEGITDRIDAIKLRFQLLRQQMELAFLRDAAQAATGSGGADKSKLRAEHEAELAALDEELEFLVHANTGGEFLNEGDRVRIQCIGERQVEIAGAACPLLAPDEVEALCIQRGTLTHDERLVINDHMVQTIKMLEALPFPRDLRRVPEYAGGHHEKMDGSGYPRGLFAGDMSIPARIMAIADVFEALTAQDRPYKKGKSLSEAMRIMGYMKRDNHIDPDLFDLFVTSGVWREYGEQFLPERQLDEVDVDELLEIEPRDFDLPSHDSRAGRWRRFLPEYEERATRGIAPPPMRSADKRKASGE
ncbi:MAG: GAF domain-containing protein [Myxococcales bacterium]|nr:GAF domain-containing protein [Myxococcales bacterium]